MKYCENCGVGISDSARFCRHCGAEQTSDLRPREGLKDDRSPPDNYFRALWDAMGLNVIWYVSLFLLVIYFIIVPNALTAYKNISQVLRVLGHKSWGLLLSPSAYLFFIAELSSLFVPIQMLLWIPVYFENQENNNLRKYGWTLLTVAGIVVFLVVIQIIIWGSYPVGVDAEHYVRLRMIPFFPWPQPPIFQ